MKDPGWDPAVLAPDSRVLEHSAHLENTERERTLSTPGEHRERETQRERDTERERHRERDTERDTEKIGRAHV